MRSTAILGKRRFERQALYSFSLVSFPPTHAFDYAQATKQGDFRADSAYNCCMTIPDLTQPHTYPRRILLAVAANSPQIVTETVYALTQHTRPSCMPTEIHVITTRQGEPFVRQLVCGTQPGWLAKLCADYALPAPACDHAHIHLITDADGQALDDIRTHRDNTHAADCITRIVQQLTADPHSQLTVSLSGGRRTMTFYVGYALSLLGRAQDRLTHVLVDQEYFFHQEFFYPPPRSVWVVREDGSGFDASKVEVTLASKPLISPRNFSPFTHGCTGKPATTPKWRQRCAMASPKRGSMNANRTLTKPCAKRWAAAVLKLICCTRTAQSRVLALG